MIDWHRLLNHDPIRRLGDIIQRRFNVWSGFIDRKGLVMGLSLHKPGEKALCGLMTERSDALGSCARSLRGWMHEIVVGEGGAERALLTTCHAGLSAVVVPLRISGEVVGGCYASGFWLQGQADEAEEFARKRGEALDWSQSQLRKACRGVPILHQREVALLGDLCQAMLDEALTLQPPATPSKKSAPKKKRLRASSARENFPEIIGESPVMLRLFSLMAKVARSRSTVLIQGEGGTGKELVARAVHFAGERKDKAFVVQNCSAMNDSLLDSELFGHKKGAFTGSISDHQGLFSAANHGSFFLDEVGDMSPRLQVKLLRVLQERTFQQVGGSVTHKIDVRIIAATNCDLQSMVEKGTFRRDLFYRLNVINIRVPPLRERKGDIPALVEHFLSKFTLRHALGPKEISPQVVEHLARHDWPGNIRELENEIERLVVLSGRSTVLSQVLLSPHIRALEEDPNQASNMGSYLPKKLPEALEMIERHMILGSLRDTSWNKTQTAKALGISRRNLIRKVERYQLELLRYQDD